jgi:hypothetical protein
MFLFVKIFIEAKFKRYQLMGVLHEKLDLQGHYSLLIFFSLPPLFSLIPPELSSPPSLYLFNFPPLFSLIPPDLSSSPSLYLFNFFLLSHTQPFILLLFFISPGFFLLSHTRSVFSSQLFFSSLFLSPQFFFFSATHASFFLLSFFFLLFFFFFFFLLNVKAAPLLPALPTLAGDPNARPNTTGAPGTLICSAVHR